MSFTSTHGVDYIPFVRNIRFSRVARDPANFRPTLRAFGHQRQSDFFLRFLLSLLLTRARHQAPGERQS